MARGSMHPDTRLDIALTGAATKAMHDNTPVADAVAELRLIAKGRSDLLAQAAGRILGSWLQSPGTHHPGTVHVASLLIMAGADPDAVVVAVDRARKG